MHATGLLGWMMIMMDNTQNAEHGSDGPSCNTAERQ